MYLQHVPTTCSYKMHLQHAPTTCTYNMRLTSCVEPWAGSSGYADSDSLTEMAYVIETSQMDGGW